MLAIGFHFLSRYISYLDFQRFMRTSLESAASGLTLSPLSPTLKATGSRSTGLTNNATGAIHTASVDSSVNAGRETGDRWNGVGECGILTEQGCETSRGPARWRSDGSEAFSDVAIRSACSQTRSGRSEGLHVRHGLLHAQRRVRYSRRGGI